MKRRQFFSSAGVVGVASLSFAPTPTHAKPARSASDRGIGNWFDPQRVWHFFDLWHLDHFDQLKLCQGSPAWQPKATYVDPPIGNLSAWPTVYREESSNEWRMLYSADWKPYGLMVARSDDGINWSPLELPNIQPEGKKLAPHHVFTLPGGSAGAVYIDPVAKDGFRFKVFVHQQGDPVVDRAKADPDHRWHSIAKAEGSKRYINEEFTLVSEDGIHWQERRDRSWSRRDWHPEPPIFAFYNRHTQTHSMTVRPGWGDRRQCLQTSRDFLTWSGPELLLQPDAIDAGLPEIYGMPVFAYGDGYIGLPWMFHCESDEPTRGFNRFVGSLDCQLATSRDGMRFARGLREPFIKVNELGQHGCGAIQPSCLVETDEQLRFYSAASMVSHGRGSDAKRRGIQAASITLHTLRKDGVMYIGSAGAPGRMISKPLTLVEPNLSINAEAPFGEVRYQLTDLESRPIEGYTFEECAPLQNDDQLQKPLRWNNGPLAALTGRAIRLEFRMRHAKLYAVRGHFHFIDAQDMWMLKDGKPIPTQ